MPLNPSRPTHLPHRQLNYQGSNSGQPHITRDDIAGELAKFQDKPIELYALCLIWWPGGVAHAREAAERALVTRSIHRWEEHNKTVSHCEFMKQIARLENNTSQATLWKNQQAQAIACRFPKPNETDYRAVIHAAAMEFAHPLHCKSCHGSGSVKNNKGHIVSYERCHKCP